MSAEAVARRYAKAVYELAVEQKTGEAVRRSLQSFAAAYLESDDLKRVAISPSLTDDQRAAVIRSIGEKLRAEESVILTVELLVRRGRLAVLPDMATMVAEMLDAHEGIVRVQVRSAVPLDGGYVAKLKATVEKALSKKAVIATEVDPTLIGGVVATIGDRVIDGSIRGRLRQVSDVLQDS